MTAKVIEALKSIKSLDVFENPSLYFIGGEKLRDENAVALRMAGLAPDEYMLKFNLDGVKLEFFRASTPLQISVITDAKSSKYLESSLCILDVKSIAKLKLIALLSRNKSRDLFDFKVILEKNVLSIEEIIDITSQTKHKLSTLESLYTFIEKVEEPKDDEVVYLDEEKPINLSFDEIKAETLNAIRNISWNKHYVNQCASLSAPWYNADTK
jgi:hypothetical protein